MRWEVKPLGEVCDVLDRMRKPITKKNRVSGPIPYYGATGIVDMVDGWLFDEPLVLLGEDGAKWGRGDRSAFLVEGKTWVNNHAHVLRTKVDILDSWLIYSLNSRDLSGYVTGMTVPKLNQASMRTIPVPIPPIAEQEQIVEVLDEAFAAIDKAKANIERNLTNARELFQSRLNDIFSNPSEDWVVKPLGEVCSIVADLVDPRQDEYLSQLHVGGGNIESESGHFIELKTSAEEGLKSGKFPFTTEDVLYNKIRPYLVKVARPDFEGICSADMYPLRPSEDITRDFLFYALISERFTSYAISVSARAGMPKVNRKDLFNYDISLPLKKEQERITKELDTLIEMKRSIEIKYQMQLKNLDELRQSILDQAFVGKLTAEFIEA